LPSAIEGLYNRRLPKVKEKKIKNSEAGILPSVKNKKKEVA